MKKAREYYVYMLECEGGRLYTGYTVDVRRRLNSHMSGKGGAKFTRGFRPQKIAALWMVAGDRGCAMKVEAFIKSLVKDEKKTLTSDPSMLADMVEAKGIGVEIQVCDLQDYALNSAAPLSP